VKRKGSELPLDIIYNTQQEFLIMPEYGRNVQQLVRHAQKIEDDKMRQAFCEEIVNLIQQLYPQSKNIDDYREKLWQHLFHIAKYKLDAYTPSGRTPRPEDAKKKPERIPYPPHDSRYRHYGNHVHTLINKAIAMEPGVVKDGFVNTIGSYMKLAYKTWNREHYVSDEIIKLDLRTLSKGQLNLEDDSRIDGLSNASKARSSISSSNNNNNRDRNRPTNNRDSRDNRGGSDMRTGNRDNRDSRDNRGGNGNNNKPGGMRPNNNNNNSNIKNNNRKK
jgi:hypothetical protein